MPVAEAEVLSALGTVLDPEIGLDIVALGLVYGVRIEGGRVEVDLTMTTAACPLGDQIAAEAEAVVVALPGVDEVAVRLVWDPPWTPERMSPDARETFGWMR